MSGLLIVSDLDGTLLRSDKTVSERTRSSLIAAREAGIPVAAASARPFRLINDVLGKDAILFDAFIVSNGAAIIDVPTREVLHERLLSDVSCTYLIGLIRACWPAAGFGWELGTHFVGDAPFVHLTRQSNILRNPVIEETSAAPQADVHQLVFAVPGLSTTDLIDSTISLLGADYDVTDSSGGVIEIALPTATKLHGAQLWALSLGLELSHVVAFGDELNDLLLLESAGEGYAMANAIPRVRDAARYVTASNDQDGVALIIEQILARSKNGH